MQCGLQLDCSGTVGLAGIVWFTAAVMKTFIDDACVRAVRPGRLNGTAVGWVYGLKSQVRNYFY